MEKRVQKNLTLPMDVIKDIETNNQFNTFSDWVEEQYRKEFMSVEIHTQRLDALLKEVEGLKEKIRKCRGKTQSLFSAKESEWIRTEGRLRIKKFTFEGVFQYFVTEFERQDVSRRQFRIELDKED